MPKNDRSLEQARWDRAQGVLGELLALPAEARSAVLEERCGDDHDLRAEVESLLGVADASDAYFGDLADRAGITLDPREGLGEGLGEEARASARDPHPELIGQTLGQYEVLRWLGQGGMASVYLAERKGEGFTQRVALKVVSKQVSDSAVRARSNEERRILAQLEHRNIARLIDGGLTADGFPFYAMEYVEGEDLLAYCDGRGLTVRERLVLFLEVCAPVQFAHERLVVHCDLKPSNILVTDDGHVKLLDFGVARMIDPNSVGDEATGLWFTPAYASPEQVRKEQPGTASDVYSLGVLLYEVLTGHRPYRFPSRERGEVMATVGEVTPPRPSEVVTQPTVRTGPRGANDERAAAELSRVRGSTPQRLRRRLKGDLDAIVMKALAKDPAHRYRTADQLASDIRRHLDHETLSSVPPSRRYRASKFVRRHRGMVLGAAVVLAAVGAGLAATLWQASRATAAAALARQEADKAELVASLMSELFRLSDPNEVLGDTITARDLLDRGTERIQADFADQPIVQAQLLSEVAGVYRNLGLYRRAEPLAQQAYDLTVVEFGEGSEEASERLIRLGGLFADLGRHNEAIETLDEGIRQRAMLVEGPDPILIDARRRLAWHVRADQEYDRAAELFRRALADQRLLDPNGPEAADMMFGLAATYHDAGLLDEADLLLRNTIDNLDTSARPSPMAIGALRNVGMIRRVREQYREAEPVLRSAAEMATRLYGPEHVEVYETKAELGLALGGAGEWDEAEEVLRDAILGASSMLGTDHPTTAGLHEALGSVLLSRESYEQAWIFLQLGLAEKVRRHDYEDHPGVVASLTRVAEALTGAGRLDEAREYVARAEEMIDRLESDPSVYSISTERSLGNIASSEGDHEVAEAHFRASIELAEQTLRPNHRYVLWSKRDYAVSLTRAGRGAEAAPILEGVLATWIDNVGSSHPIVDRIRADLAVARGG